MTISSNAEINQRLLVALKNALAAWKNFQSPDESEMETAIATAEAAKQDRCSCSMLGQGHDYRTTCIKCGKEFTQDQDGNYIPANT